MQNLQEVQRFASALHALLPVFSGGEETSPFSEGSDRYETTLGIVLGTGLSGLIDVLPHRVTVPYAQIPGNFPVPGEDGHVGAFVWGRMPSAGQAPDNVGRPVLVAQGRCHLYEGRSPAEVCTVVRVMAALGVKTLIITNAAGALNPQFAVGSIMCMTDIINHTGVSPLTGPNCATWGPRFPDMSSPLDPELCQQTLKVATRLGLRLEQGVYIGVHGPELETPAETRMYRQWGADAVGMSTVLEIIAARHLGMRVLGLSCLTNKNLPDAMRPVSLEEIQTMAARTGRDLVKLIQAMVTSV